MHPSSKGLSALLSVLLLGLLSVPLQKGIAQETPPPDPETRKGTSNEMMVPHGTLMIVGGGITTSLRRRFAKLAGESANVACVPTALPHGKLSGWCRRFFREARIPKPNRAVLHTRKSKRADTKAFAKPLRTADAVWFTGGRQWRLVEAYAGTRTEEAFHDVLRRGGVIGGTSAGASIQGSFLVRGDPKTKKTVVGKYTDGFGFLPQSAIDQHLRARNREEDLVPVIEKRPHLLGLGIDEGTAAIVRRDTLSVVGEGIVAVYDAQRIAAQRRNQTSAGRAKEKPYFFLHPGDRFSIRTRTVLSDESTTTP